ncbi:hypothetical protein [Aneurinibacillus sp. REN35]|uniref:hypothetical protein n=1 Tax=Aneurinibacillus sp. REN35 TaxID=3237286 RepID=UPI00352883CD
MKAVVDAIAKGGFSCIITIGVTASPVIVIKNTIMKIIFVKNTAAIRTIAIRNMNTMMNAMSMNLNTDATVTGASKRKRKKNGAAVKCINKSR